MKNILFVVCFAAAGIFAQDQRPLGFRPVAAEWSASLQRVIAIASGPNQLAILDPVTNTYTSVGLSKAPLSLSVSLDGYFAAVGHDGLVSYVNLATGTLVRATNVSGAVTGVATNNGWIYAQNFGAMRASTGAVEGTGYYSLGDSPRIDPSAKWLYGYYGYRFDISNGTISNSSYNSSILSNSRYTFSADGLRAYVERPGWVAHEHGGRLYGPISLRTLLRLQPCGHGRIDNPDGCNPGPTVLLFSSHQRQRNLCLRPAVPGADRQACDSGLPGQQQSLPGARQMGLLRPYGKYHVRHLAGRLNLRTAERFWTLHGFVLLPGALRGHFCDVFQPPATFTGPRSA